MILNYLEQIQTYIKENPALSIIFTVTSTLMVWLYKESRNSLIVDLKQTIEDTSSTLSKYGMIESSILIYLKHKTPEFENKLYEIIGQSTLILSDRIRSVFLEPSNDETNKFTFLLTLVQSEIHALKMKLDKKRYESKVDTFEKLMGRLIAPTKPIFILIFIGLILFICIILWDQSHDWFYRVNIVCFGYSFSFGIVVLTMLFNELIDGNISNRTLRFIILSLIISFLPFLSLFITQISIGVITVQIVVVVFLIGRRNNKNTLEVVQVDNNFR